MSGNLVLAGAGIGGPKRMTLEVHDCLQGAKQIFHLTTLQSHLSDTYAAEVIDLASVYHDAATKTDAYEAISTMIIRATEAAERDETVVFLTYGHPLFLVNSSLDLQQRLACSVLPAISSFDTLLIDSPVQLSDGAQLFEATKFVALRQRVARFDPLVLFQFGDYAARDRKGSADVRRLRLLKQQLLSDFPEEHQLYVIVSSWEEGVSKRVVNLRLGDLDRDEQVAIPGSTLIIPPVETFAG